MKPLVLSVISILGIVTPLHAQEPSKVWTNAATASKIQGTLVRKARDNSKFTLRMIDGKEREFNTAILIQTDMDYVMNWKSIVTDRASRISQAQGGGSRVMVDLESVLQSYGKAVEATGPHPEAIVYKGQAWYEGGPQITIPYLMPLDKAVALLVQRPGIASRGSADAPGLPPGMKTHEYDVKFGVYNRMVIIADQYDQVVALEAKSENKNDPATPQPTWKAANTPNFSTSSYIKRNTQGAKVFVCDLLKTEKRIVIDSEFSGENLLFLPEPMINLCLFHIDQDLRKAAKGPASNLRVGVPSLNSNWKGTVAIKRAKDYFHPASARVVRSGPEGFTIDVTFENRRWTYKIRRTASGFEVESAESISGAGISPGVKKLEANWVEFTGSGGSQTLRFNTIRLEGNETVDSTYDLKLDE